MINRIEKILPWLLLVPAFLPIVFINGLLYPYVSPKTLLLRGVAILAVASFTYLALSGRPFFYERLKRRITWIPGMLLVVMYVTSLVGTDFYHSFWSIFDRGDGLLTATSLTALFYLFVLIADTKLIKQFFKCVAWVASAVAVYAILQWLQHIGGIDIPFVFETRGRIGSTLGNAAFLAGYIGTSIFISLIALKEYKSRLRKLLIVGIGLQIGAVLIAATRGTMLALICALICALGYLAIKENKHRMKARSFLGLVLMVITLFVVFRDTISSVPIEPVRRLASISLEDETTSSRLFLWKNLSEEALQNPIKGVGAEHVGTVFNRIYDPTVLVEQWFDRSHNAFLDYMLQFGIFGLALYTSLILSIFALAWKLIRNGDPRGALFGLLAITYSVQNFFVFDTATTLWVVLTAFATLIILTDKATPRSVWKVQYPTLAPYVGSLILLPLLLVVWLPLQANLFLAEGYLYHIADIRRAVGAQEKGLKLNTYADKEYGYQAYQMYTDRQQYMLSGEARLIAYRYARDVLMANMERYAYDARTATYLAHVLEAAPPEEIVDEEVFRTIIANAIQLSPKRSQAWFMLANVSISKGDSTSGTEQESAYQEAISVVEAYDAIVPNSAEASYVLATLYLVTGDREKVAEWANKGLSLYSVDESVARRAARVYIALEDWENAEAMLYDVVVANPDEFNVLADLAKAAFLAGNKDRALKLVILLREKSPEELSKDPAFEMAINDYEKSR